MMLFLAQLLSKLFDSLYKERLCQNAIYTALSKIIL